MSMHILSIVYQPVSITTQLCLYQWFSILDALAPREQLAMSGHMTGHQGWGEFMHLEWRPGMLLNTPQYTGQPPYSKALPSPSAGSTEVQKPQSLPRRTTGNQTPAEDQQGQHEMPNLNPNPASPSASGCRAMTIPCSLLSGQKPVAFTVASWETKYVEGRRVPSSQSWCSRSRDKRLRSWWTWSLWLFLARRRRSWQA